MGDTIESAKINSFLLNDFKNYNIDELYNKLLINQSILNLQDYNDTTNNYNDKLLNKTLIDITINNILEDNINYYLDDFKLNNEYISGSIDIDLSYYASNEIKYYSMILDFLTEYYKNLANIIKDNEYLDNKSLYEHEFEIKMRYDFEDSRIKQLNENKVLKFKVGTSQDISGYKDIVAPNNIIDNYRLFEINEGEMNEIKGANVNSYKTFIKNYIIDNNYLNFDINKIDYYFLLTKSYLYKFYKLLLNYHISKAIYFYYQHRYKNKVPEINDIISNKFPKIFENFELILNGDNNDLSILKIVENTKKKQKVLEEKKKEEINKLSDTIKVLETSGGDQTKIEDLKEDLNNLYTNGYITADQAKINEAIRYKKDLHNINNNLIDNEEKIKKLDNSIKRDKSYLNQVNIIMYICIFVLVIIFFTFSITNLTNVNISVAIVLLIISMILYFSSNYYINNSNHEHKKTNLFSNLFNNFIIIENYEDESTGSQTNFSSTDEPIPEDIKTLLDKLKGQFNDEQIVTIIDNLKSDTSIINGDGYVTGTINEGALDNNIINIINTQYDSAESQYENNISLKKREGSNDFYNLLALSIDTNSNPLDSNLNKFFATPPNTVYETLYKEISNTDTSEVEYNIIILPNDGSEFTEYELNIPSYFGDSFRLSYDSTGALTEQQIEREDIQMDITVVGGGSAGQSFTKPADVVIDSVRMTELGSGGSGGAVIQITNFSFTPGKYIIGVGKGGIGNTITDNTDSQNKLKSGRGSYLKTEDDSEHIPDRKNNFIIFACGGIYHDTLISQKKISKSGGRVDIVNEVTEFKTTLDKYKEIDKNIIKIPGIRDSEGFILNKESTYSKGGEGGNIKLEDIGDRTQLFISNEVTEDSDEYGYAVFYNSIRESENEYSESRKNGKQGIGIETISRDIIPQSYTTTSGYDIDKIVNGNNFYISGGGGAIGVCSNKNGIAEVATVDRTKLFISCDDNTDIGGSGGIGGGGKGKHNSSGDDGYDGTGSGGGGGGYIEPDDGANVNYKGGNGGSGVVIIKYNKQELKRKFDRFKQDKINEIKTILLRTIANGNLLKLETKFQELRGGIQELNTFKESLKGLKTRSDTLRDNITSQLELQGREEDLRNMNLYGYFMKKTGETVGILYEITHSLDSSTIYRKVDTGDYLQIINEDKSGFITFDSDIKNELKSIFDKKENNNNLLILDNSNVTFLLNNRDKIEYIDEIYVPGVVYLRELHLNYISTLTTYYQTYGGLLNQDSAIEEQIAVLDSELSSLDSQIDSLEKQESTELGNKAIQEKRNSDIVRRYNAEAVKEAQGNLCLSIVNELIIGLQKKLQEKNSLYTSDKMRLNAQLTYLQDKAIKEKNAAREAKKIALEQQAESEKELEEKRQQLFNELQSQDLPENKKSFLIDFEFDLDYKIAGNLLDSDDISIFGEENVKIQNEKRRRFESKIKRELYEALKKTYQDTAIDITPNRFEINRISSGNLYDNNRTRQNTGSLTAAEIIKRAFIDEMMGESQQEEFIVEEHFDIDTPETLQENRMVVEMEILPNSKSFFDSQDSTDTARDILYKILNLSSCKINPDNIDEVEPDMKKININTCTKTGDESKELLNNLNSELRIKRYFRYLTRYRVGAGMGNFIQHYLKYTSGNKDIVKNEVDSTWIDVVKTDGLFTNGQILVNTYSKIDHINDNFVEIDRLRFEQETYYDKMNPLLKKEYKKYDEIENNNNIYKKMKQQSDNINTYDIRLKETLINYFVTLSILVSLYLIIIHYINHIVVLLILILIIVVMSTFLLMNIYQIVKTRANKNYWPKENKFLQINI